MGKKKQGVTILKGSLQTHWIKYLTSIDLQVNPADKHSWNTLNFMLRHLYTIDAKYVQPGFKFNYGFVANKGFYHPSIMHIIFLNGYERKYNMGA